MFDEAMAMPAYARPKLGSMATARPNAARASANWLFESACIACAYSRTTSSDVADSVSVANRRVESDVLSPRAVRTRLPRSVAAPSTSSRPSALADSSASTLPVTVSAAFSVMV